MAIGTILNDAYTAMYNLLSSNLNASYQSNVHPAYNDQQLAQEGYPQIIVEVDKKGSLEGFGGKGKRADVLFTVTIYSDSALGSRTVADDVYNVVTSNLSTLQSSGFYALQGDFHDESRDRLFAGGRKFIHIYEQSFSFVFREQS